MHNWNYHLLLESVRPLFSSINHGSPSSLGLGSIYGLSNEEFRILINQSDGLTNYIIDTHNSSVAFVYWWIILILWLCFNTFIRNRCT